jgi:hypothetical protein
MTGGGPGLTAGSFSVTNAWEVPSPQQGVSGPLSVPTPVWSHFAESLEPSD